MAVPFERASMIARLRTTPVDVLVIGGGITGCGVALDAATRGLTVALVERDDFASGTSSKSSKLIHGGLRYLQQGDVGLVREALRERQRLLRNAPHLVSVLPFLIPVLTRDGPVSKRIAKALRSALWMYDLAGGLRIGKRHRRLGAEAALAHCPTLPADRVSSGFVYYDAHADDARVTLAVARTAARHAAIVVNRCAVVGLTRATPADGSAPGTGAVTGAHVHDRLSGATFPVRARCVVSATGVWVDEISALEGGDGVETVRPAKGVHLTLPWDLVRNDIAVIISVPEDKRSLFLVPWGARPDGTFDHCYVGTTDTDHTGGLDDPHVDDDEVDYVLAAVNRSIRPPHGRPITRADVTAAWAGLRPLVRSAASGRTADLSRRHRITTSAAGVVSVTGGKFTTYRAMAEETVDVVMDRLGHRRTWRTGRARTRRLRLVGGDGLRADDGDQHLVRRYGTDAHAVLALTRARPELAEPLVPGLRYLRAEAVYAVRSEMAVTLTDVLARRTRAHLEDRAACRAAAPAVATLLAEELGWDAADVATQVAEYQALCDAEAAATRRPDAQPAPSATAPGAPGAP